MNTKTYQMLERFHAKVINLKKPIKLAIYEVECKMKAYFSEEDVRLYFEEYYKELSIAKNQMNGFLALKEVINRRELEPYISILVRYFVTHSTTNRIGNVIHGIK